jgi:hypothetical protein
LLRLLWWCDALLLLGEPSLRTLSAVFAAALRRQAKADSHIKQLKKQGKNKKRRRI